LRCMFTAFLNTVRKFSHEEIIKHDQIN
jgi:hypothetical protein